MNYVNKSWQLAEKKVISRQFAGKDKLAVGSWQLAVGSNFKKLQPLLKQFFAFN